ncbi:alpha/beta fold hydrolase [Streptomyces bambusae]|uniref:alpha/beta fold hydrolase n=1 Tax=Streptomyces bambusae TaxID=1550616 RepID=UPI002155A72C|nr:alpha/beta hydrolase [Streptomyces bambusae]
MPALGARHRVIAVDLRGMGGSATPDGGTSRTESGGGYDKKTMAADVRALLGRLGIDSAHLVGHDIGAMVAYAHAVHHPEATRSLALLDVPHPDDSWAELTLLPQDGSGRHLWWFAFNQVHGLPEALLAGRYHLLLDWLFTHAAADPDTIDARARAVYARAYDSPEAIRAGNDWYRAFGQDIADRRSYGPLTVPVLALGGDRSNYESLREVVPPLAADTRVVRVDDCGHYLPEEQPEVVTAELLAHLGRIG